MIAVTTRSRLRGLRFFPAMALATVRVRRQLARTPGAVRWASLVASPTEFWTITVWRSHHELQEFMRSDAHGEIMWSFSRWTRAFWLARWRPTAAEWGSWDGLALAAAEPPAGAPPDSAPAFLRASMDGAGRLTLAASPLVRRSRANLAGLGGIVLRLPLSPCGLVELRRVRRSLRGDGGVLRVAVGTTRRQLWLLAVWRRRPALLEEGWPAYAAERWRGRLWALEWVAESEFGHWDGLRQDELPSTDAGQLSEGHRRKGAARTQHRSPCATLKGRIHVGGQLGGHHATDATCLGRQPSEADECSDFANPVWRSDSFGTAVSRA